MLPTFIVIGAMRCGTTSLYYLLSDHPEIGMSARKETDFFIVEGNYNLGLPWYQSQFPDEAKAIGECSPNYTKRHLFLGAPKRIKETIPDVKLIYLIRDPVQRTISHYLSSRSRRKERRTIEEALSDLSVNNYVLTSMYYKQIELYLKFFPMSKICIVTTEELNQHPVRTTQKIYRFLGVNDQFESRWIGKVFNSSSAKRVQPSWLRWISDNLLSQQLKDEIRPYFPEEWLPGKPLNRPEPSPELKRKLASHLRPDVKKLRALTDRVFDEWSLY